jgi:leucyl-tRNA synthetase
MMAPITPHIAEELWEQRGLPFSIHQQPWPEYDAAAAAEELITIVLQVNGKVRDKLEVPVDTDHAEIERLALESDRIKSFLDGKPIRKVIIVPGKLVNIVI